LYMTVFNCSEVVGIYIVTLLTAWNMDNFKCACRYGYHSSAIVMNKIFMVVKINCGLVSCDTA
jgi:putative Mn2+ efflux pump MntP